MSETKKCTKCGIEKSIGEFSKNKKGKLGIRASCRKCCAEYRAEYNSTHKIKNAKYAKDYNAKNVDKIRKRARDYYRTESGKARILIAVHKYRSKLNNLPFSWTEADIRFCLDYWNNSCVNCNVVFDDSVKLHWDHYIPISNKNSKGTVPKNMLCLCSSCNQAKSDKLPQDFFDKNTLDKIELYFSLLEDRSEAMCISEELDLMITKLLH